MVVTLFASCQKDNFAEPTIDATYDFTASFAETRTSLDGTAVEWSEDDLLTIFTKTSHNRKYQVKELSEDGRTATFGYMSFTGSNDAEITSNYALYPYDADATLTGGVVTTTLQPTQTYNGANGNLGYALMAAQSATNNFSFRNAGSLLRFKLSKIVPDEFTLNSIKVASASNNIAGEVTINMNNTEAKAIVTSNGVKEITLADINYDVTTDVKEFYVAMPSMSFADKDLTVTFVFEEGEKVFELPAFDLEQGKIKSITYAINDAEDFTGSTPDEGGNSDDNDDGNNNDYFEDDYAAPEDMSQPIKFVDNNVKTICLVNWDTNGDAELSYDEAIAVTDIGEKFKGLSIMAFDELEHFRGLTTINDYAFENCSNLAKITLPNTVTDIGNSAFSGCSNLNIFIIPFNVSHIGYGAFKGCVGELIVKGKAISKNYSSSSWLYDSNFTKIVIGDGIESIGDYMFAGCDFESLIIPNSITTIGEYAFYKCGITDITIPESVNLIGSGAFAGSNIKSMIIPNGVTTIGDHMFDDCTNLENITLNDCITSIGDYAFKRCSFTNINIPDSVTSIGDNAFENCWRLKTIELSNSTTYIGNSAFAHSSIEHCNIPSSVVTIGDSTFAGSCLTEITIPNNVTSLGDSAFKDCDYLITATIEKGATCAIGDSAFYDCENLTNVTIGSGVKSIGDSAFWNCGGLTSVNIGDGVTAIGFNAFAGCDSLTSVTIPNSVTTIGDRAFVDCGGLMSANIGDGVTTIGDMAFYDCSGLTSVNIGKGVTTIGDEAFYNCSGLTSIIIPDSVITIGYKAFNDCDSVTCFTIGSSVKEIGDFALPTFGYKLKSLYCKAIVPPSLGSYDGSMWHYDLSEFRIYVYSELVSTYKENLDWSDFRDYIVADGNIPSDTNIPTTTFLYTTNDSLPIEITGMTVVSNSYEDNVGELVVVLENHLPSAAFSSISNLISMVIPENIESIGDYVFSGCLNLENITILNGVQSIGTTVFNGCNNLVSITFKSENVPTISVGAFDGCSSVIYVPANLANSYRTAQNWNIYYNRILPDDGSMDPGVSPWSIIGSMSDWTEDISMLYDYSTKMLFVQTFFDADSEFKFRGLNSWDINLGANNSNYINMNSKYIAYSFGANIKIKEAGTYIVYLSLFEDDSPYFYVEKVE